MKSGDEDFKQFLTHPLLIDHAQVTSASVDALITDDIVLLYKTNAAAGALGKKIQNFLYFRATIVIRLVVQGQPFAGGKVVYSAYPNPKNTLGNGGNSPVTHIPTGFGRVNCQIVPHIVIDPAKNASYEMRLPICTTSGNYSGTGSEMGSYRLERVIFNALISGTAVAPTMNVCTYMYLEDVDFEGITLLASAFTQEKEPGKTASTFAYAVSKGAKVIGDNIPVFGPAINLFSKVSGTVGDVLSFLGFSKPPNVENIAVPLNRFGDNYSQFDGKSTALVLAGSAKTSVGFSPLYGAGDSHEMLFEWIMKQKGLVQQNTISQAVAAEANIYTLYLNPAVRFSESGGNKCYTPMGGCVLPFTYWVGDFIVEIEVIASIFHRASLLLAWDPSNGGAPSMQAALQTLKNVTIPVSGNTSVKVKIPYKQNMSYQFVSPGVATASAPGAVNGTIYLYLINPVTANGSTDGIYVNTYYSTDNMKMFAPSTNNIKGLTESTIVLTAAPMVTEVEFGTKTDLSLAHYRAFGEEYHSIKQLTSKLTLAATVVAAVAAADTNLEWSVLWPNYPWVKTNNNALAAGGTAFQNFASYFATAFLGYRGGMRMTFHAAQGSKIDMLRHHYFQLHQVGTQMVTSPVMTPYGADTTIPSVPTDAGQSYAWGVGNREVCPTIDGVFPAQHPYDFVVPRFQMTGWYDSIEQTVLTKQPTASDSLELSIYTGSADDASYNFFLGFAIIT